MCRLALHTAPSPTFVCRGFIVKQDKATYSIQSVSRAFELLEMFSEETAELSFTELCDRLQLGKNYVFRLLATLESRNYLQQDNSTGNYRLGIKNLDLRQSAFRQMELLRQSRPVLESQTARHKETTYVAVMKDRYSIYLDSVESDLMVRVVPRLGVRFPTYCTATGKVQLAFMARKEQLLHLPVGKYHRYTPNTITDRGELQQHLKLVAEQGYACDNEEFDPGVRSISAPVRDAIGSVVGAISISGPVTRLSDSRINDELLPLVKSGAAEISNRLGFK